MIGVFFIFSSCQWQVLNFSLKPPPSPPLTTTTIFSFICMLGALLN